MTKNIKPKILVAMSGGVDSAVAASRLQQAGYEVYGVVFRMSPLHDAAVSAADNCCRKLGIPLTVRDMTAEFERVVIDEFCRQYAIGRTPNPCVICNPHVKFRALADTADALGIEFLATGHYARIIRIGGTAALAASVCAARDQSYMLYRLPQDILERLVFPLEDAYKEDVRGEARALQLPSADTPDSQEICFIEGRDYPAYLHARGVTGRSGRFLLPDGRALPHAGVEYYTVGQRRGLCIAYSEPLFVKEIRPDGDIVLSVAGGEYADGVTVTDAVFSPLFRPDLPLTVKIRSMAKAAPCRLTFEGSRIRCRFEQPQRAPAPGQSAVFYRQDIVVGGGFIDETYVENKEALC